MCTTNQIVKRVLNRAAPQHKAERDQRVHPRHGRNFGNKLENKQHKEVEICDARELLVQIAGQKGEQ